LPDMSFFGASLNPNGYQALPSGLIIQWGKVAIDYTGSHTAYVVAGGSVNKYTGTGNFPVTFPNAALVALGTSNDVPNAHISSVYVSSTRGFIWSHHSTQAYLSTPGGGNGFTWIALGY
ncbi:gp53-like domain-containing protein, partial [Siccibacter colletis]|uniref:gp53-like domain-containing protein n=1 Tax=Siccibacter colletis TaxID=1505757 RepID=UPI001F25DDCC